MRFRRELLVGVVAFVLGFACGGGSDEEEEVQTPAAVSGEPCVEENSTTCGKSTDGQDSVLVCVAVDADGNKKWSESEICSKAETCEGEGVCTIDCDSAWLCDDKVCGDDGCGGSCGGCPVGTNCIGGTCKEYVCEPLCEGAACGPDGCGGECGTCEGTDVCLPPDYACGLKPNGCVPDCTEKQCGPNGCGGSCGVCDDAFFCMPGVQTCEPPCTPSCDGRVCGDDGCGGSCGGCLGDNEFCINGQCGPCDPIANDGCPEGSYCTYTGTTGPICDPAGTQKYGEPCGGTDSCAEGVCIELSSTEQGALCYRMCLVHSDCGEGNQCMDLQSSLYKVCGAGAGQQETCNLLTQECSLETDGCYFDGGSNAVICLTAGPGVEGDACAGQPNDCAEGFTCTSTSGAGWICRKFCNTQKGEEPLCDAGGPYPKCTNYLAAQKAGYCKEE